MNIITELTQTKDLIRARADNECAAIDRVIALLKVANAPSPLAEVTPARKGARKPALAIMPERACRNPGGTLPINDRVMHCVLALAEPFGTAEILEAIPDLNKKTVGNAILRLYRGGMLKRAGFGKYERAKVPGRTDLKALHQQIRAEVQPAIDAKREAEKL